MGRIRVDQEDWRGAEKITVEYIEKIRERIEKRSYKSGVERGGV